MDAGSAFLACPGGVCLASVGAAAGAGAGVSAAGAGAGAASSAFFSCPGGVVGGAASADPVSAASAIARVSPAVRWRVIDIVFLLLKSCEYRFGGVALCPHNEKDSDLDTGYARKSAPKRSASASVMRPRRAAASPSESVRSGDWKLTAKAIDFFPGGTWSPR